MGSPLLSRVLADLDEPVLRARADTIETSTAPLASRLATGLLAWSSVTAASLLAGTGDALPDPERTAVAYRSERVLRIDGAEPPVWAPLSGFWRTGDGWIRTHANYPHHAARLCAALRLPPAAAPDDLERALLRLPTDEILRDLAVHGALGVKVSAEDPETDARLRDTPLLAVSHRPGGHRRARTLPRGHRSTPRSRDALPLDGIRVVDLTRVIAGPIATRTLALWGADVLRVDPPGLPEPEWQHLDTGQGKRSTVLDARSSRMEELLAAADVVVLGYRPSALTRLGLDVESLADRHPHLVVAQLSAWGLDHPSRAGFDSLVQAESGIAWIESPDGSRPGALPAQALDHSAGYLLAAATLSLVRRREREAGTWAVRTSLRRIAAELLGMPRADEPPALPPIDSAPHVDRFVVGGRVVTTAASALPGRDYAPPRPWGLDQPAW
ncbi:CoA transferase [Microbacterium sp. 179-I 3D4 NHS]|uniref:CoA transferase n=1 Tax=Microbacterium sp. 179-I 3D4 NHS TaxID=3142381 RepID=UPI0039A03EC7